jgi:hypothetical protein
MAKAHMKLDHFGAVMKDQLQSDKGSSPYSPLSCFLLLLLAGVFLAYKIDAANQLIHLAHGL